PAPPSGGRTNHFQEVLVRFSLVFLAAAPLAVAGACLGHLVGRTRWTDDLAFLARECQRGEELESRTEGVRRTAAGMHGGAAEVIAGRMTLREAAGHFRRLHAARKAVLGDAAGASRLPEDERLLARLVISWVQGTLVNDPRRAAEVVARLEEEQSREQPLSLS